MPTPMQSPDQNDPMERERQAPRPTAVRPPSARPPAVPQTAGIPTQTFDTPMTNTPGAMPPAPVTPDAGGQAAPVRLAPSIVRDHAVPQAPSGPASGVNLTPTDPNNPLTAQTITPGATADRYAIAQQRWDQFQQSTDPAYQAVLRQANRYGAAQGRLGSGSLRTEFGNLANLRNQQLDTAREGFLTNALEGSIDDVWKSLSLAERQQAFQNMQQQQAWRQGLDQFQAGQTSNPYGAQTDLAGMYGNAGQQAGNALTEYWRSLGLGG